jgi:hypothetical protein
MTATINRKYYVYVYIDPRNLEEFYYGKVTCQAIFGPVET